MGATDRFRILAPVTRQNDIAALQKAGAQELFCGYVSPGLAARWPIAFNILNRRGEQGTIADFDVFRSIADDSGARGLPLYVTVNGLYTPEQYGPLLEMIWDMEGMPGVRGVIVADVGLLLALRKHAFSKEIHVGTGGSCFNAETADLFAELGASRVVLDRQMTAGEIRSVARNISSGIRLELFVLREGHCGFIDGLCTFLHCYEDIPPPRGRLAVITSYNTTFPSQGCHVFREGATSTRFRRGVNDGPGQIVRYPASQGQLLGCRLCDLHELRSCDIAALKVVGRGADIGSVVRSVEAVARALSWLERGMLSGREYRSRCRKLFSSEFHGNRPCAKTSCYFSPRWLRA